MRAYLRDEPQMGNVQGGALLGDMMSETLTPKMKQLALWPEQRSRRLEMS
jgi:hypothetical protein